jgi:hypothetical protein
MNNVYNDSIDDFWFNNKIIDCGMTIIEKKLNNNIVNNNNSYTINDEYENQNQRTDSRDKIISNTIDKSRCRTNESEIINNRKITIQQSYRNNVLSQKVNIQENDGKMYILSQASTLPKCRYKHRDIVLGAFTKSIV